MGCSRRNPALTFFSSGVTIRDSGAIRSRNSPSVACAVALGTAAPTRASDGGSSSMRHGLAILGPNRCRSLVDGSHCAFDIEAGLRPQGVPGTAVRVGIVLSSKSWNRDRALWSSDRKVVRIALHGGEVGPAVAVGAMAQGAKPRAASCPSPTLLVVPRGVPASPARVPEASG